MTARPQVVIVGSGFAGVAAARALRRAPVRLYQVATAARLITDTALQPPTPLNRCAEARRQVRAGAPTP